MMNENEFIDMAQMVVQAKCLESMNNMEQNNPGAKAGVFVDGNEDYFYLNAAMVITAFDGVLASMKATLGPDDPTLDGALAMYHTFSMMFTTALMRERPEMYLEAINNARGGLTEWSD